MDSIHTFDVIVVAVVAISGILAFMHGFVREALSIATWIGAGAAAVVGYPMAREVAGAYIPSPLVADFAAGALLFVGAFLLLAIVARAVGRALESADGLGPINRSLGLLFGILRGALIVTVAYLALAWTVPERDHPTWITEARTTPIMKESSAMLEGTLPASWRREGRDAARAAEEAARSAEMLRGLNAPTPAGAGNADRRGYDPNERKSLDDLIKDKQ